MQAKDEERIIGHIDGVPVSACYMEGRELGIASVEWRGLRISTDGVWYLNLGLGVGTDAVGDIHPHEWPVLCELTRAGVVERLLTIAQAHRWIASAPQEPADAPPDVMK